MDNDKLKLYLDFAKFFLGTFLIALITFIVKSGFESREIAIKESEQIGKYVEIALREDVGVRKRFSEYFKTVTISDRYRNRWTNYYELVRQEFDSIKETAALINKQIDSINKLLRNSESDKDSIRNIYRSQIDILKEEKTLLEEELDANPEEKIPEAYQVVINSLKPSAKIKETIITYLKNEGFEYMGGNDHETDKKWIAETSTVFYYTPKSRFIAKNIASDLKDATGINFNFQLGENPGIRKARRDYIFIIHYIN